VADSQSRLNPELENAIREVYAGPLESFVDRRNALEKELRSGERREDAKEIKSLRKPSRMAWALNAAAAENRESTDRIAASIADILDAQSGEGDLRTALSDLREAVQSFASKAERAAKAAGHSADHGALVNAVMAVIGASGTFDLLQAARLADVPEAGGLDFLTSLPPVSAPRRVRVMPADDVDPEEAAARETLRQAEAALAAARERSTNAERALREAQLEAEDASRRLRLAQKEAHTRQVELDRTRKESSAAAEELAEAEKAMAEATQLIAPSRTR
jgi:hypothetical protein